MAKMLPVVHLLCVALLFSGCVDAAANLFTSCFGSNCSSEELPVSTSVDGQTIVVRDELPEKTEIDLHYNYDVNGLTLLEKIKLVRVLNQMLLHGEVAEQLRAKSSLIEAIEHQLDVAPPQYSVVQAKFLGFILNPDQVLESTWLMPEYRPIPEFASMQINRDPLELKKELAEWKHKNKAIYDANVERNMQTLLAHQQVLTERGEFQHALNVASFYKLGACLAQKLVRIFGQNAKTQHLQVEYAGLGQHFQQVYEQIEKEHLADERGHKAQQKLICPKESNIDDVDAHLVGIIAKSQWSKDSGIEDQDFVAALALVLELNAADGATPTKAHQMAQEMANGEFGQAKALIGAVKVKAKDMHKQFVQQQEANASTRDKLHKEMMAQVQLRKTALPLHKINEANAVQPKSNKEGGDGPLYDTRYQALLNLSAGMHIGAGKASREQNLVNGVVPILLNAQDVMRPAKGAAADGQEDAIYTGEKRVWRDENGELMESRVPTQQQENAALKKYTEFMQLAALFGLAKCVSEQVQTRTAARKYQKLVDEYAQLQKTVIGEFVKYAQRSGNKLLPQELEVVEGDVHTVVQLICLPQAEEDKGRLVRM